MKGCGLVERTVLIRRHRRVGSAHSRRAQTADWVFPSLLAAPPMFAVEVLPHWPLVAPVPNTDDWSRKDGGHAELTLPPPIELLEPFEALVDELVDPLDRSG